MKFLKIFWAVFFSTLFLICVGLIFFIHSRGKALTEERFSRLFNKPVTIESIHLGWPLRLQVDQLLIPKVFSAKRVSFNLGFLFSSSPQVIFSDVIVYEPVIYYGVPGNVGNPAGQENIFEHTRDAPNAPGASAQPSWRIFVRNLLLRNGQVFYQGPGGSEPFDLEISEMQLRAENVSYPLEPQPVVFDFEGRVKSARMPFSGQFIRSKGWFNYPDLSMDAHAKVLQQDGAEGVVAHITSVNNDMKINGKLNVGLLGQNMARMSLGDVSLGDMVMGALQTSGIELIVDFEMKTHMNNIRLDKMDFSGNMALKDLGRTSAPAQRREPRE